MITVTVCVGSSCHLKGARQMIARFNDVLAQEGLAGQVELKGSFCMEHCGEGINWTINDELVSSASVEEGAETFRKRILTALREKAPSPGDDTQREGPNVGTG